MFRRSGEARAILQTPLCFLTGFETIPCLKQRDQSRKLGLLQNFIHKIVHQNMFCLFINCIISSKNLAIFSWGVGKCWIQQVIGFCTGMGKFIILQPNTDKKVWQNRSCTFVLQSVVQYISMYLMLYFIIKIYIVKQFQSSVGFVQSQPISGYNCWFYTDQAQCLLQCNRLPYTSPICKKSL